MSRARIVAAVAAWVAGAFVLLLAFAGIGPSTPLSPARSETIAFDRFEPAGAQLRVDGDALRIVDAGAGQVFVAARMEPFDASAFRHLDVNLEADSDLLYAMFAWNVDGRWHSLPLPGFVDGAVTIDLSSQPGWQGQVQGVGIALLPIDLLPPQQAPARDATLHVLRLRSDSAGGALSALATAWTAYRQWNGRSNHSSGFELGRDPGPSLTGWVAALLVLAVAIVLALVRPRGAALRGCVAVALIGLAGWQIVQLTWRASVAWDAHAAVDGKPGMVLSAMPALEQEARALEPLFEQAPPPPRIAIWGANNFFQEYPAWLLRRHNVGSLRSPGDIVRLRDGPLPAMVLLAGPEGWTFDEATGALQLKDAPPVNATAVRRGALLHLFQLQEAAP